MGQKPHVTDIWAWARQFALDNAINLSAAEAHEVWRAMQIIATGSLEGLTGPVTRSAMRFNQFPAAWKVIAVKALAFKQSPAGQNR